jgi:DHA2 family multidrug resistance protein
MFAFSATFAPAIGPTFGGWLNDTLSWHFIFYVNLLPGLVMLAMLWVALEPQPVRLSLLKQGDWAGIATIAIGLGTLQTALEEGNRHDWFGSPMIVWLSVIAAISLSAFLWIELTVKNPLVDLRLLRERNFKFGTLAMLILGFLLYGSVFVLPLYLSQTQGYNAMQIGEVLAWTGLPQLALIPFMPWLMKRFDLKLLLAFGFTLFAVSNFMNMYLTGNVAADQLFWPNVVRAIGQAFVMTPLTAVAAAGLAPKDAASASAILNMTRNLGGAFGIAALQTYITKREQFHSNILSHAVSVFDAETGARISRLTDYFMAHGVADAAQAWHKAVIAIGRSLRGQAYIMAYSDAFILFGAVALLAVVVVLMLRPVRGGAGAAAGGH